MSETELFQEFQRLRLENRKLKGPRLIPHGPLTTTIYKHTRWKAATQKTLAELVRQGRLTAKQLASFCSEAKIQRVLRLAREES